MFFSRLRTTIYPRVKAYRPYGPLRGPRAGLLSPLNFIINKHDDASADAWISIVKQNCIIEFTSHTTCVPASKFLTFEERFSNIFGPPQHLSLGPSRDNYWNLTKAQKSEVTIVQPQHPCRLTAENRETKPWHRSTCIISSPFSILPML